MDRTYSLHCPKSENHLVFKVADGPDHSMHCPKNENHLGFKVADGPDHSLHCPANENHLHIFYQKPAYEKLNAANLEAFETVKLRRTTSKKPDNL